LIPQLDDPFPFGRHLCNLWPTLVDRGVDGTDGVEDMEQVAEGWSAR